MFFRRIFDVFCPFCGLGGGFLTRRGVIAPFFCASGGIRGAPRALRDGSVLTPRAAGDFLCFYGGFSACFRRFWRAFRAFSGLFSAFGVFFGFLGVFWRVFVRFFGVWQKITIFRPSYYTKKTASDGRLFFGFYTEQAGEWRRRSRHRLIAKQNLLAAEESE